MLDARSTDIAPRSLIRREDYRAAYWLVPDIELEFELDPARTIVRARLSVERNGSHLEPLCLDGEGLELISLTVDGQTVRPNRHDRSLTVPIEQNRAIVETVVAIAPATNSQLMGLYESGGILCTQCEAEGFRRITFFPDRPDVLSTYRVRMTADRAHYPALLANGDPVASGELPDGRHWAEWHDPFPKPCYLFALVAGDLVANRDSFVTRSGKAVDLAIWVREGDLPRTEHAMQSLKAAMAWDEKIYGREYDLAVFNIVAVADFNFGAMENKGLNIFNSRYVLADPDTATDADYDAVAAVVAHEYFHNWSGNRVTCRDWFQLSLKEGFTVFRDQQFSADQGSPAVKRIEDVRALRAAQFPEDAGPLAHPVRPESYIEISNFYTATVYNKGAELIRMMHTILGPEKFRAGTDLYFERHDGEAATCEDFVRAMEEASGVDLRRFRLWYSQAGTPRIKARLIHAAGDGRAHLQLEQQVPGTPGQDDKRPMPVPLKLAMFGELTGEKYADQLVLLEEQTKEIVFEGIGERPVLSINRDFSAPVIIDADRSRADLALLSARDDNPFARYEAMQQLMLDTLIGALAGASSDYGPVIEAVRATLSNEELDAAFMAEAVSLPNEALIGDQLAQVDPEAIHVARQALLTSLGQELEANWRSVYDRFAPAGSFELSPAAKGARKLRTVALSYLVPAGGEEASALAFTQFTQADNMTDRHGALRVLADSDASERMRAFEMFYERFRSDALVIDKWFATQALSRRDDTVETVERLAKHPDFTIANPNRLRALVGSFTASQRAFHHLSGRGYRFLADMILAVERLNPQSAARLVPPLGRWRRFDPARATLMKEQLERIAAEESLSKDVYEQVSKSLA